MSSENNRSAPDGATPQPESVMRLLRDPEALAAIERLASLGYSPRQVGEAMTAQGRPETEAEVRAALASYGLDYDEVGDRGVAFIEGLLAEKRNCDETFSALAETGPCGEPDCHDGYVHEDGEVSLCWRCSGRDGEASS